MKKQMEAISKRLDTITVKGWRVAESDRYQPPYSQPGYQGNIRISPALLQPESKESWKTSWYWPVKKGHSAISSAEKQARNLALEEDFPESDADC